MQTPHTVAMVALSFEPAEVELSLDYIDGLAQDYSNSSGPFYKHGLTLIPAMDK